MNIPDTATLRKAIAITTKIERLQEELRILLTEKQLSSPKASSRKTAVKKQKKSPILEKTIEEPSQQETLPAVEPSAPLEIEDTVPELLLQDDAGQEQLVLIPNTAPLA